jgi:hypothetical protein
MSETMSRLILCAAAALFVATAKAQSLDRAVSFAGFFNSETSEFRPEPIEYGAVIDFQTAQRELHDFLAGEGIRVRDAGEFENVMQNFDDAADDQVRASLLGWLRQVNDFLLSGGTEEPSCEGLRFPEIARFGREQGWNDAATIYVYLGLEALSPGGQGLRSGLSLLELQGDGQCRAVSAKEYDFSSYDTSDFVADCIALIEAAQQSLQAEDIDDRGSRRP